MKYINSKFENVTEFLKYIESRTENEVFKGETLSSKDDNSSFRGTKSFEEAQELLKYGDKEKMKLLKKSLEKIRAKGSGYKTRRKVKTSIVGCVPHIPNYLQGIPECMIDVVKTKIKSPKVLTILYNPTVHCGVGAKELSEAGAKMLSYVSSLESQGYRVNLYLMFMSKPSSKAKETLSLSIRIKSSDQYLDLLKTAYILANPSMLRRHWFRFTEVAPITDREYVYGYGVPLNKEADVEKMGLKYDYYFNYETASNLQF